jgi:hypothetical protein
MIFHNTIFHVCDVKGKYQKLLTFFFQDRYNRAPVAHIYNPREAEIGRIRISD